MTSLDERAVSKERASARERARALLSALSEGNAAEYALARVAPSERRLLRCCALVRRFDESLLDEVLKPLGGVEAAEVTLDRVVRFPGVAESPGRAGWYRVDPGDRAEHEQTWFEKQEDGSTEESLFREANGRLADWFEASRADEEIESLYCRLGSDPDRAKRDFEALYRRAAQNFDLARCETLLEVLDQRSRFLGTDLASVRKECRAVLRMHNAVADDYFRSVRYLERKKLHQALTAALEDPTAFIFNVHGTGGRGKTMFLRWLSSRYCLERGIPIARVDFDFLEATETGLEPRFFFGKLAESLNLQLPEAPFEELIGRVLGMRRAAFGARAAGRYEVTETDSKEAEVIMEGFGAILEQHCRGNVLLVFDTLEDARLKHKIDVLGIVDAVARVQATIVKRAVTAARTAPRILLVLSGRYPLGEQYPEVVAAHGPRIHSTLLDKFDRDEARAYLIRSRKLPESELLDSVVQRSDGNPFTLALYADLIQTGAAKNKRDIEGTTNIQLLYLIKRILQRIPDYRLRWVLRYGVVARRFTRDFLEKVLGPHLARALRGERLYDDPVLDDVEGNAEWPGLWSDAGGRVSAAKLDYDDLWRALREYAGTASWITDSDAGESLVIQPTVTHPMRRALRRQEIVHRIHRDAVDLMLARLKRAHSPDDLASLTYHDFQLRGRKATGDWERRLRAYEDAPESLEALASVVLSEDLRETEGRGRPLVTRSMIARAHFALAWAAYLDAESVGGEEGGRKRQQAAAALEQYVEAAPRERVVPIVQEAMLRFELAATAKQRDEALSYLKRAERSRPSGDERTRLLRTFGRAFETVDPRRAEAYAMKLVDWTRRRRDADGFVDAVQRVVGHRIMRGAFLEATQCCQHSRSVLEGGRGWRSKRGLSRSRRELKLVQLGLEFSLGVSGSRLAKAALGPRAEKSTDSDLLALRVTRQILLGDPKQAIREAERFLRTKGKGARRRAGHDELLIEASMNAIQAQALRLIMRFDESLDHLQTAMSIVGDLGVKNTETTHRLAKGQVYLFDLGDLRQVEEHLRSPSDPGDDAVEVSRLVLEACLADQRQEFDGAGQIWSQALVLSRKVVPSVEFSVLIPAHALLTRPAEARLDHLRALRDGFCSFDHPLARMARLPELSNAAIVENVPPGLADDFEKLSALDSKDPLVRQLLPSDERVYHLKRSHLLRIVGKREAALAELRTLRRLAGAPAARLGHRAIALLCDRLQVSPEEILPPKWLSTFQEQFAQEHGLLAVTVLEAAERAFRGGDVREASTLATRSRKHFTAAQGLRSRFEVRLMELFAKMGYAAGNPAVGKDYDARAERMRDELGVRAPGGKISPKREQEPAKQRGAFETLVCRILSPVTATLDELHGVDQSAGPKAAIIDPVLSDYLTALTGTGPLSGSASLGLVEDLAQGGQGLADAVTRALIQNPGLDVSSRLQAASHGTAEPLCIAIESGQHRLHALPWELAAFTWGAWRPDIGEVWRSQFDTLPRARVRWAQQALTRLQLGPVVADGVIGAQTERAIERFQKSQGMPVTGALDVSTRRALCDTSRARASRPAQRRVLLLESSEHAEIAVSRGMQSVGVHLEDLYRENGFSVHAIREPDVDAVRDVLQRSPCDVLHLSAPIGETHGSGELYLQFGSAYAADRASTILGPSILGSLLKSVTLQAPAPLVVVDIPCPPSATEAARQLVLRNVFSSQLSVFGALPALVATGLFAPHVQGLVSEKLVLSLTRRPSPGELARELRRAAPSQKASLGHCVALFAVDPALDPQDLFFEGG